MFRKKLDAVFVNTVLECFMTNCVLCVFLMVLWVGLQTVAFPGHTQCPVCLSHGAVGRSTNCCISWSYSITC